MRAAIVVPCLNEELSLSRTCSSLGFGVGAAQRTSDDAHLVLVDNGSEDQTWAVMEQVRAESPKGTVTLVREPERSFVAPRHRGALEARKIARASSTPDGEMLIVQADADTVYGAGYVRAMIEMASSSPGNSLIEGIANPPVEFRETNASYVMLCEAIDASMAHLFVEEADDIIVVDALCAYTIEDYFAWGGHSREFTGPGEEVHAETSRLYVKARLAGALRLRSPTAVAWPSRRKVVANAALHFAMAGFPRDEAWQRRQGGLFSGHKAIADPMRWRPEIREEAIFLRSAHSIILFAVLPSHVARLAGNRAVPPATPALNDLMSGVSNLSKADILGNTATLFERGLALIETHREQLEAAIGDPSR
jgi:hypothetical protein